MFTRITKHVRDTWKELRPGIEAMFMTALAVYLAAGYGAYLLGQDCREAFDLLLVWFDRLVEDSLMPKAPAVVYALAPAAPTPSTDSVAVVAEVSIEAALSEWLELAERKTPTSPKRKRSRR